MPPMMESPPMRDDAELPVPPEDPIVAEVRATRAALSAAAGNDLERIYARLKAVEAAERRAGRIVLAPPPAAAAAA